MGSQQRGNNNGFLFGLIAGQIADSKVALVLAATSARCRFPGLPMWVCCAVAVQCSGESGRIEARRRWFFGIRRGPSGLGLDRPSTFGAHPVVGQT